MSSNSDGLLRSGRILLFIQFSYVFVTSVGLFLWRVEGDPERGNFADLLRFAFELCLFFLVWRGWRWAKWLMVALCSAAAVGAAFVAKERVRPEEMRIIVIALALFYGWIAVSLVSSRSIKAFLNRNRGPSQPAR